jgi:AraC-like DNA-binding protein
MDVVAVLPDATLRARLAGALRGRGPAVRFCATAEEARAALARGAARALVVGACDGERRATAPLVERVRREHPHVTVAAYCALARGDPGASAALVALVRAGAHAVLMRDVDDDPHALRAALRLAEQACASELVLEAVGGALPPGVRPLVALYLRGDERPPEVGEAARALGVHRRTLVNRMRAAGCPPPRALRTWCRVFVAARLLEEPGRTVESVALQLDFDSPSGLRNTLRRYTGRPPAALRAAGGLRCALDAFAAACALRRAAGAGAPRPRRSPGRAPARAAAAGPAPAPAAPGGSADAGPGGGAPRAARRRSAA